MLICGGCNSELRPSARICLKCGREVTQEERDKAFGTPAYNKEASATAVSAAPPYYQTTPQQIPIAQSAGDSIPTSLRMPPRRTAARRIVGSLAAVAAIALFVIIGTYGKEKFKPRGLYEFIGDAGELRTDVGASGDHHNKPQASAAEEIEHGSPASLQVPQIDKSKIDAVAAREDTSESLTRILRYFDDIPRLEEELNGIEEQAIEIEVGDVTSARKSNESGLQLFRREQYQMALQEFSAALEANPADVEAMNNVAYVLIKLGEFRKAEPILGEVLSRSPNRSVAWANLGEVYANTARPNAAAAAFVVSYQVATNKKKSLSVMSLTEKSTSSDGLRDSLAMARLTISRESKL